MLFVCDGCRVQGEGVRGTVSDGALRRGRAWKGGGGAGVGVSVATLRGERTEGRCTGQGGVSVAMAAILRRSRIGVSRGGVMGGPRFAFY